MLFYQAQWASERRQGKYRRLSRRPGGQRFRSPVMAHRGGGGEDVYSAGIIKDGDVSEPGRR